MERARIAILVMLALLLGAAPVRAQGPTAITSSGLGTTVTPSGGTHEITGGTRGGQNLFHSFGQFSVGVTNGVPDTALFKNTTPNLVTRNILSRVTGGERSSIYGTIDSATWYPGTNLFLINPAGVIFGATATLNVGGSFHVSSADYIRFADGSTFCVATCPNQQASTFSMADPASFGFLGPRGPIMVDGGFLQVLPEKTLGIVGGAVTIVGGVLQAPSGRVQVASVTGGEVSIATLEGPTASFGQVGISGGSSLDANGDPHGSVVIRGGQVTIDGAFISAHTFGELNGASAVGIDLGATQRLVITNSSTVGTETSAGGRGGDVQLAAPAVEISGSSSVTAVTLGAGRGGDVRLTAAAVEISGSSTVAAATLGAGRGGDVDVTADTLRVTGSDASLGTVTSLSTVTAFGGGQGGDMRITVGRPADGVRGSIEIADGAVVSTQSLLGDNALLGTGAGTLSVTAAGGTVTLAGGGSLASVNFDSTGPGGNIAISADTITISGRDASGSPSRVGSSTNSAGDGGGLSLSARLLTLGDGGTVVSQTSGDGRVGDVSVTAGSLTLMGGGTIGSLNAASALPGGNVTVTVTGPALISGAGSETSPTGIFTSSTGTTAAGDPTPAGRITLDVGSLDLRSQAVIQSGDVTAQGGGIAVTAHGVVSITDRAGISSQTFQQDVGSVTLSAPTVVIDGGFINTSTLETGRAGSIVLNVGTLLLAGGGQVASSSVLLASGPAGNINVTATESITITGASPTGQSVLPVPFGGFVNDARSGIYSTTANTGPGGNITLRAPQIQLADGGTISASSLLSASGPAGQIDVTASESITITGASSFGDSGLFSTTAGTGPGGNITLRTAQIQLADGGTISSASTGVLPGSGSAGHIDVTATGAVTITGGSSTGQSGLFSTTAGPGAGGNITLSAPQIQLADGGTISAASTSVLPGSGPAGNIDVTATESITITGASPISESGLFSTTAGTGPGGNITLRAGQIQLADGGTISASSTGVLPGSGPAGHLDVTATGAVTITGGSSTGQSGLFSTTTGTGAGGNITLSAPQIQLADGGTISAASTSVLPGSGPAGNIDVTAGEAITITGSSPTGQSGIFSTTAGTGPGGNITIGSSQIQLLDGGTISAASTGVLLASGSAGQIDVTAGEAITITGSSPTGQSGIFSTTAGTGPGGNITLRAPQIRLAGGGTISASSTGELPGSGPAGQIDVTAGEAITITGSSPTRQSGIFSTTAGTGSGGNITIGSPQIQLLDGGTISAASTGVLLASGSAGQIGVTASESITITGSSPTGQSGIFSTTAGSGPGGNITLSAPQIRLADGGTISASSTGSSSATAGSINITFGSLFEMDHASISTDSVLADGGNITITSTGSLLHLIDSQITTSVRSGVGGGGNITLGTSGHPLEFVVLDHGGIHADAFGGPGGSISIFANVMLSNTPIETAITASSTLSAPGTVTINAVVTDVSASLAQLSTEVLEAAALLRASCATRLAEGKASSLVVAGREGVPLEPGGLLPSVLMERRPAGAAGSAAPFLASEWPGLRVSYLDAACGR